MSTVWLHKSLNPKKKNYKIKTIHNNKTNSSPHCREYCYFCRMTNVSLRKSGEKMSTRKQNYNGWKRWTNWEDAAENKYLMPRIDNLGEIQRHSPAIGCQNGWQCKGQNRRLSYCDTIQINNEKKKKGRHTHAKSYTTPFLTYLSKLLLCMLFKRIATKKTQTKNPTQPTKKSPTH